jgi:hypothetical protein
MCNLTSLLKSQAAIIALCLALSCGNAPRALAQPVNTKTSFGVPLDELIAIRTPDGMLKVPAGYLFPWPRPQDMDRTLEQKGISFVFWRESRRYLELNAIGQPGFWPQEKGREKPTSDTLIKISGFRKVGDDPGDYKTPEKSFDDLAARYGVLFAANEFGLEHFRWPNYPGTRGQYPPLRYRSPQGTSPQALIKCTGLDPVVPNPLCDAEIYFVEERFSFLMRISRRDLPNWRQSIDTARELYLSWKVDEAK